MTLPQIPNLEIHYVTNDILLLHQIKAPFYFSCCDGLLILPKKQRNASMIVLDANIEPKLIREVVEKFGPVSDYVCSHGHMDHIAHIHQWEDFGAKIYAPAPESNYLTNLYDFYEGFGFNEELEYPTIQKFADVNGYAECREITPFNLGVTLEFENFRVETIAFVGHSKGHVGFFLPQEGILHISCLGFDQSSPDKPGFGPWYGFKECSIEQYLKDIDFAELIFMNKAKLLTSSHSYVVKNPNRIPFKYMREKIEQNQDVIDDVLSKLKPHSIDDINLDEYLKLDLFFPKKKMKGFLVEIYNLWERWIIIKHLQRSSYFSK